MEGTFTIGKVVRNKFVPIRTRKFVKKEQLSLESIQRLMIHDLFIANGFQALANPESYRIKHHEKDSYIS